MHDLWHVLTEYGRDELGEACLLGFTYAQNKNRGVGFIAFVGCFKLYKRHGFKAARSIFRGYLDGRRAAWLPQQDWEALLHEPITSVRRELNLADHRCTSLAAPPLRLLHRSKRTWPNHRGNRQKAKTLLLRSALVTGSIQITTVESNMIVSATMIDTLSHYHPLDEGWAPRHPKASLGCFRYSQQLQAHWLENPATNRSADPRATSVHLGIGTRTLLTNSTFQER